MGQKTEYLHVSFFILVIPKGYLSSWGNLRNETPTLTGIPKMQAFHFPNMPHVFFILAISSGYRLGITGEKK
jgi:hypothetical protein